MVAKNYITENGFELLRREYFKLLNEERPKLVETIAWAASNGDRSENADYIYGKRRLREIDRRLGFLAKRLEESEVVRRDQVVTSKVAFGCLVEVETEDGKRRVFRIVGEDESAPEEGKISWKSPLAKVLLGKSKEDEILFQKPSGEEILVVVDIRREKAE